MAVKASAHITLSLVVEIEAYYRYYLLQSSTSSAPSVPTANPPGGSWTDAEPSYTSGSTNSLYFVDLTVFSNGTYSYSGVSLSSSYEAAKEAYNKAAAAQNTASSAQSAADQAQADVESAYLKTVSKGEQLVLNGSALLGDNTNFSSWTYDGAVTNNTPGSFSRTGRGVVATDEYFPVNPQKEYTLSFDAKSLLGKGTMYSMLMFYDVDKKQIVATNHMYVAGTLTTLANELKAGDTVIYLTDVSGWQTNVSNSNFMSVWNYTNSFGYTYPAETYTRNSITLPANGTYLNSSNIDYTANTITLTTAYSGSTIPAGTEVSQGRSGSTYKYNGISNKVIPTDWLSVEGVYNGVDYSGGNVGTKFSPGTAYAKVGFLWNYNSTSGETQWITNVSVTDTTSVNAAQSAANAAQSTANSASTAASNAQNTADAAQSAANTAQTAANAAQSTANSASTAASNAQDAADAAQNTADAAQSTANTALAQTAEFIKGTQTASTNAWTGTSSTISALYDGLQITYWLPYAGTSSSATLNLTLSGGGTTGAKNVYYRGTTRVNTHFAAGTTVRLTYRVDVSVSGSGSYTGWWADGSYEGSNTYDRTRYSNAVKSLEALTKSTYYVMVGTSAGYKKAASGVSFDISYPVLTWYYTSAVSANATTTYMYTAMPSVTLRNNVASWTGTQYAMAYLVGTLDGTTFTINDTVFTCTAPTEADGLFYIPIGILSTTYKIYFRSDQTIYAYGANGFAPVSANAQSSATSAQNTADKAQTIAGDAAERITAAETAIDALKATIANFVRKGEDSSLVLQDENGAAYFDIGDIIDTLDNNTDGLSALDALIGAWEDYCETEGNEGTTLTEFLKSMKGALDAHGATLEYVHINLDYINPDTGEEEPCIELGKTSSDFKLFITNTRIVFMEGSNETTYIKDNTLVTNNVEVKNELKQTHPSVTGYWMWSVRQNGNYGLTWKEG